MRCLSIASCLGGKDTPLMIDGIVLIFPSQISSIHVFIKNSFNEFCLGAKDSRDNVVSLFGLTMGEVSIP